jgi:hypothetical protein
MMMKLKMVRVEAEVGLVEQVELAELAELAELVELVELAELKMDDWGYLV